MQTLQARNRWNHPQRNFEPGDVVLVVDEHSAQNQWEMAREISVNIDKNNLVHSATIKAMSSMLERPISKLVLQLGNEQDQEVIPLEEPS